MTAINAAPPSTAARTSAPDACGWLGAIALVAGFAAMIAGCGSPCEDLDVVCDVCPNAITTEACDAVVEADDGASCETAIDTFEPICNDSGR